MYLLLIISSLFHYNSTSEVSKEKTIIAAEVQYKNGQYDSSLLTLNKLRDFKNLNEGKVWNLYGKNHLEIFNLDTAYSFFSKSIVYKNSSNTTRIDSWLRISMINVRKRKLDKAKETFQIAQNLYSKYPDQSLLPYLYFVRAYLKLYSKEKLISKYFEEALENIPNNDFTKIKLYYIYLDVSEEENTAEYTIKLLNDFEYIVNKYFSNNLPANHTLLKSKSFYYNGLKQHNKSIEIFENEIYPILKENKSRWSKYEFTIYHKALGEFYSSINDYENSISHNLIYLNLIKDYLSNDHAVIASRYQLLADQYRSLGNFQLYEKYTDLSYQIWGKQKYHSDIDQHKLLSSIRNLELRNWEKSRTDANYLIENSNLKILQLNAQAILFMVDYEVGNYGNLVTKIKRYLKEEAEELNTYYGSANKVLVNQLLIKSLLALERYSETCEVWKAALKGNLSKELFSDQKYESINLISENLLNRNHLDSAYNLLKTSIQHYKSIDTKQSTKGEKNQIKTLELTGIFYYKKFQLENDNSLLVESKRNFLNVINLLNNSNNEFKSDYDRIKSNERKQEYYSLLTKTFFELYKDSNNKSYLNEFFCYNEISKSSQLLESLNRQSAFADPMIPDSISIKINSLKKQATFIKNKISTLEGISDIKESDSLELADLKITSIKNEESFKSIMLFLEKSYPAYYELSYHPKIATVEAIQEKLKANEALIEYYLTEVNIYAIAISKSRSEIFKLDTLDDSSIKNFSKIIQPEYFNKNQQIAYNEFVKMSSSLYNKILKIPLTYLKEDKINKLYIIPDKSLNYLPFELLIKDSVSQGRPNYSNLNYLIKDFDISYDYSSTILLREKIKNNTDNRNGQFLAVAPSYKKLVSDNEKLNKLGKFRDGFEELKYNKKEVEQISKYFTGKILSGEEATKTAFNDNFKKYDIIHLAMHALIDNDDADNSRLVFSTDGDSIRNSFLYNFELYNMNATPKLAVLSACNTGLGELKGGEGVMSLSRAFTYAGAESVLMSHWRVNDESSSVIMDLFYKYLAEGKSKDAALRLAKIEYLKSAPINSQHPFHWNNFVIIGDMSPLVQVSKWYLTYWFFASIAVLILLSILVYRKVKLS